MKTVCWIDGQPSTTVHAEDRGLHYGDGLFETMVVRGQHLPLLGYHLERLALGCARLGLVMPAEDLLQRELQAAAQDADGAILKLIVTRGVGGRGYAPPDQVVATRILLRYPRKEYPAEHWQDGVRLRVCEMRLGRNRKLAGLKHLNRLEQVLARSEWRGGEAEGLMLDEAGLVIEGTMSNVFAELAPGVLATPAVDLCGVAGVMRRRLLERAGQAGLTLRVAELSLAELLQAREIFICNSVIGVWPVAAVGERRFAVGSTTRRAQQWASGA